MAKLKNKVKTALGEARMLILGAHVLLGFQFRAAFEKSFETLPLLSQAMKLSALGLMLLAVGLLIAPTAYHRIVERGEDTEELLGFTTKVMLWALLPFALGLGLDMYVAGEQIVGRKWAAAVGFVSLAAALFFWYLLEYYHRRARAGATGRGRDDSRGRQGLSTVSVAPQAAGVTGAAAAVESAGAPGVARAEGDMTEGGGESAGGRREEGKDEGAAVAQADRRDGPEDGGKDERKDGGKDSEKDGGKDEGVSITDKIDHVLMEARVVLPGAQALLGFQFVAVLTESFAQMPSAAKYVHLASLLMVTLTIVLLMTPAAYHRIVEQGEETEHFHRFASRFVVAAMVPLALALSGDVYVVVRKVTDSQVLSIVSALVSLAMFWELWFGLTLYRRTQRRFTD